MIKVDSILEYSFRPKSFVVKLQKMNILVTGGAGFIGTNACLSFKEKGFKVAALDNFSKTGSKLNAEILKKEGIKVLEYDVTKKLPKSLKRFEAIIHLAAIGSTPYSIEHPYEDFVNSALGTVNVLELVRRTKVPLIYTSTCKVYSSELNLVPTIEKKYRYVWSFARLKLAKLRPAVVAGVSKHGVNENFPMDSAGTYPHAPYGISHATGDLYCQEYFHMYGVPTVVNRMSTIYGPYQQGTENQGWVDWVVTSKLDGKPLNLVTNGKTVRDILWVDDLVDLFLLEVKKINKVKGLVFNVGGGPANTLSIREAAEYLDKTGGKKMKFVFGKSRPADQKIYISDIRKVKKTLSWKPIKNPSRGINELLKWYGEKKLKNS